MRQQLSVGQSWQVDQCWAEDCVGGWDGRGSGKGAQEDAGRRIVGLPGAEGYNIKSSGWGAGPEHDDANTSGVLHYCPAASCRAVVQELCAVSAAHLRREPATRLSFEHLPIDIRSSTPVPPTPLYDWW